MTRRLVLILRVLLLLLTLLLLGVWLRARVRQDLLIRGDDAGRCTSVHVSDQGIAVTGMTGFPWRQPLRWDAAHRQDDYLLRFVATDRRPWPVVRYADGRTEVSEPAGAGGKRGYFRPGDRRLASYTSTTGPAWQIRVPFWPLFALTAPIPALWLASRGYRRVRKGRRRSRGLCPACGYDLRASPNRCPECGTPLNAR